MCRDSQDYLSGTGITLLWSRPVFLYGTVSIYSAPPSWWLFLEDVRMIYFGHIRRRSGGDLGYFCGIKMLIGMLNSILEDEKQENSVNNIISKLT